MNKRFEGSPGRLAEWHKSRGRKRVMWSAVAFGALGMQPGAIAQPAAPAAQQQAISVRSVRVEGNTLLAERTLAELTAGVAGGPRSVQELKLLAARIQSAYRDAGYGGVVAFLPEQEVSSGDIVVRVVEGRLANVRVSGNAYFDSANVRAGLPHLREGVTPDVRAIDRDILLTNENPAKDVAVTLAPGAQPGAIDAEVNVTDSKPLVFLFGFNNTGNEATGRLRLGAGLQHSNLFGRDHVGTLQYQTSPENPDRVHIFSAGYKVPLYAQAASVEAFIAYSDVSSGSTVTPAGPLTFSGKGTVVGLRANHNLDRIGEYDQRVTAGVDWRDYRNECALGDFGSAACGPAGVSVIAVPIGIAYVGQKQGPQGSWGINASLSANAGGSSQATFEAARPGAARHYVIARFTGFTEKALADGFSLYGRLDAQYTPHALISGEKIGLGGVGSVRGYEERELTGDSGFVLRMEALAPQVEVASGFRLRPYVFVDHGRVSNRKDMPCRITATTCKLTGAGVGARMSIGKNTSAALDIGRAFDPAVTTSSGDVRGHISVSFSY